VLHSTSMLNELCYLLIFVGTTRKRSSDPLASPFPQWRDWTMWKTKDEERECVSVLVTVENGRLWFSDSEYHIVGDNWTKFSFFVVIVLQSLLVYCEQTKLLGKLLAPGTKWKLKGSVKEPNISIYFFFPPISVLFPMFCLLVEGECQILKIIK